MSIRLRRLGHILYSIGEVLWCLASIRRGTCSGPLSWRHR